MTLIDRRLALLDDPVNLEIIWGRLVTVADEMQTALRRTAFSTIVGAANDLGCDILDARGWLVAHATTSNPTFNLTMANVLQAILPDWPPETLRPGDVLITNDPWLVCGHLSDFAVITPFFKHGRVAGFSASIAHVADIGGVLNGSDAKSIYEEGLRIPTMKLYDAGIRQESLVRIIEANVRTPEMTMGDIMALVTANEVAARQTLALLEDYGLDDLAPLSDAVQARAESAMRRAIADIPDGEYPCEVTFDELDGPITLRVVLRVGGDQIEVEYVDVPPEHPYGGINCTFSYTQARTCYMLNCLLVPQIPSNEGLFRPIRVIAPVGTILNSRYPASVNDRTKTGFHITTLIQGAISRALPATTPAPGGFKSLFGMRGIDDFGVAYNSFFFVGGGMGAGPTNDGIEAICYPTSACNVPVEILETTSALVVDESDFLTDASGPGMQRGGSGLRVTVGLPANQARVVNVAVKPHHQGYPPFGLAGGLAGAPTTVFVNDQRLTTEAVRRDFGAFDLTDPRVRISLETTGGGGFGDPRARDVARVVRDVRNGLVSAEAAERIYGVRVDLESLRGERIEKGAD